MNLWFPYTQMQTMLPPLRVRSAEGSVFTLEDGSHLIDGTASWWTACHGYNHPHITHAIQQQMSSLSHVMLGGLTHTPAETLATRLCQWLPNDFSKVFFSESGSVAVEVAIKIAIQYWRNVQQPNKHSLVYFNDAYHGDTFYTMSVCDPEEGMHRLFHSILPQQYRQPLPNNASLIASFERFLQENHATLAACLLEPLVQGAGGMKMHSADTIQAIVTLCHQYDVLVIFDEIFTGFGRTGTLFAFEQTNVTPDILCLSKALTGGMLPLAATIAKQRIFEAFLGEENDKALMHGTTFMGNALACAAANASLDLFEKEDRLSDVSRIEEHLKTNLSSLIEINGVKDIRVKGAIGVIECDDCFSNNTLNELKSLFIQRGVWCRPFHNIIYTTPAFTISEQQLSTITSAMVDIVQTWSLTRKTS